MDTLYVNGLFVVASDAQIDLEAPILYGQQTAFIIQAGFEADSLFKNLGSIGLRSLAPSTAHLTLVKVSQSYLGASVANYGALSVSAPNGFATAISAQYPLTVLNVGKITVEGRQGAFGVTFSSYAARSEQVIFDNQGGLTVKGSDWAQGVGAQGGGSLRNSGEILVEANHSDSPDFGAAGLTVGARAVIENTGSITAKNIYDGKSSAIYLANVESAVISNSGLLRGDYGIRHFSSHSPLDVSAVEVKNTGVIDGRILLGGGADQVTNSGHILGLIQLGGGADIYDGRGGRAVAGVHGGEGADLIYAGNGPETFLGQEGDDTFMSGRGASIFDGGSGYDVVSYALEAKSVGVSLGEIDSQRHSASGFSQFVGIEGLVGSSFGDKLTGNGLANRIDGALGNDRLAGADGDDVLLGGSGADQIFGDAGDDVLYGQVGADTLSGGAGADLYYFVKGDGADVIVDFELDKDRIKLDQDDGYAAFQSVSQIGVDALVKLSATDSILVRNVSASNLISRIDLLDNAPKTIEGDENPNTIVGGAGNDRLTGGGGDDQIFGGRGDDRISGGAGVDYIDGGDGNDTISIDYASGERLVLLGVGGVGFISTVNSNVRETILNIENVIGSHDYGNTIYGDLRNNFILGGGSEDYLYGGGGDDRISGGDGTDRIEGGDGSDRLAGGRDDDVLIGGAGADYFEFADYYGVDSILDYEIGVDFIDFYRSGLALSQITVSQKGGYVLIASPFGSIKVQDRLVADVTIRTDDWFVGPSPKLNIVFQSSAILENSPTGSLVGVVSALSTAQIAAFTYELHSDDLGQFRLIDDKVYLNPRPLDFEAGSKATFSIKVTDEQGLYKVDFFTVNIIDVNEAPTFSFAQNNFLNVDENYSVGSGIRVGSFRAQDDALGSYAVKLVGSDAAYFEIRADAASGNPNNMAVYYVGASPDYETKASFSATVALDDPLLDASIENTHTFVLSISDLAEPVANAPTQGNDRGETAILGTALADNLSGLGGADELFGLGGDDQLSGDAGDDVLIGGEGRDALKGGDGVDTASYATAKTGLRADLAYPSKSTGDAAGDTFVSIENLIGTGFNDALGGNNSNNAIWGGDGDDTIGGLGGGDRLYGGQGNDTLLGQGGSDILEGGAGSDTLSGGLGSRDWYVFGADFGADTILDYDAKLDVLDFTGSGLNRSQLTITQSGADVRLSSSQGSAVVRNALAADLVIQIAEPPPAPTILDMALTKTSMAENAPAGSVVATILPTTTGANKTFSYVLINDAGGRFAVKDGQLITTAKTLDREKVSSHAITLQVTDGESVVYAEQFIIRVDNVDEAPQDLNVFGYGPMLENTSVSGGILVGQIAYFDDELGQNVLSLTGADASLFEIRIPPASYYEAELYYIGPQPDYELKSSYSVTVNVTDPVLGSGPGSSTVFTLEVSDVPEAVAGPTEGDDRGASAIKGSPTADTLSGLGGADELYGYEGDDTLLGGLGDDVLIGGLGKDGLNGGDGIDTASYAMAQIGLRADLAYPTKSTGEAAGDVFTSIENLIGSAFNDSLGGNNSSNSLWGGAGDDSLGGLGGSDRLFGDEGNDTLLGQGSSDYLNGGKGNDILNGGLGGRDWFIFSGQWGADTIVDFEKGVDLIDLRGNGLSLAELTIVQQGANVLISSAEFGASILVNNQTASSFALSDFLF